MLWPLPVESNEKGDYLASLRYLQKFISWRQLIRLGKMSRLALQTADCTAYPGLLALAALHGLSTLLVLP